MPAVAGRANWGARFTCNCAGLAHWQAAPGRANRLRGACARCDAWRRLSGGACVPRLLGACAAAPAQAARFLEPVLFAPRLGTCARRCRALRRRICPRPGAAPDKGARGVEGKGGKRDRNVYWRHTLRCGGSRWVPCLPRLSPLFDLLPPDSGGAQDNIQRVHEVCHEAIISALPTYLSTLPGGDQVFASPWPPSHTFPDSVLPHRQVSRFQVSLPQAGAKKSTRLRYANQIWQETRIIAPRTVNKKIGRDTSCCTSLTGKR
jgi:hypothetical protein